LPKDEMTFMPSWRRYGMTTLTPSACSNMKYLI